MSIVVYETRSRGGLKGVTEHEIVHPRCMIYFQREMREQNICCKKGNAGPSKKIPEAALHMAKKV